MFYAFNYFDKADPDESSEPTPKHYKVIFETDCGDKEIPGKLIDNITENCFGWIVEYHYTDQHEKIRKCKKLFNKDKVCCITIREY